LAILFGLTSAAIAAGHRPVIFIPGILGSNLVYEDAAGAKDIWGSYQSTRANFQLLEYPTDPSKDKVVATKILDSFQILGPFGVGAYRGIDSLLSAGLGNDYHPFPYNWRQSSFRSAEDLKRFVDANASLRKAAHGDGLIIVAHSMGGIVARLFIDKYGAQYKVDRLITIATPYYGSMATLRSFLVGMSDYWKYINTDDATVRRVFYSIPSVYELLPSYAGCCRDENDHDVITTSWQVWQQRGWIPPELSPPDRQTFLRRALASAANIHAIVQRPLPADVQTFFIVGYGSEMPRQIIAATNGTFAWKAGTEGDGTVYRSSAVLPSVIPSLPMLVSQDHIGLLDDPDVRRQIAALAIKGTSPEPFLTAGVATTPTFTLQRSDGSWTKAKAVRIEIPSTYLPAGSTQVSTITALDESGKSIADAVLTATLVTSGSPSIPLPLVPSQVLFMATLVCRRGPHCRSSGSRPAIKQYSSSRSGRSSQ
jgi:pimeloyl-ACP methyl ester carboxylesterase